MPILRTASTLAATLAATTWAISLALPAPGHAADEPYKVGVIAPTTGPVATVGLRQEKTFEWWEKDVNARGGINGRQVKVIHCNDEAKPERAVACARDLLDAHVSLLVAATVTGPIKAMLPLVKSGPLLLTASPYIEPEPDSYVFQTSPTDRDMTEAFAKYLKSNGVKKLGMVAATDASGEGSVKNAKTVFPSYGIDVDIARIDLKANDASAQLAKVAGSGVPAVYSAYSGGGAAVVVKSFSNLALGQPLVVSNANVSDAFVNLIGKEAPKHLLSIAVRAVDPSLLTNEAERKRLDTFARSYKAWSGEEPDHLNLLALGLADTASAILTHVKNVGDAKASKDYLQSATIPSFQTIQFKKGRNIGMTADDVTVLELHGGKWQQAGRLPAAQ